MVNCIADFSNNAVFNSGDEVTGSVTLYNEKPRNIRAIVLKVEGFCSTSWTEESGFSDNRSSTMYNAKEDYMNTKFILMGNGRDTQELAAGNHTFKFHFILPQNIPSSFSHHYGKVLYQIKVEMERHTKFNYSFKFPFNVICHLDLNHEGVEIRKPLRGDISKKFFLGFGSNAMNISAEIPFRGFVGGQTLDISVKIVNKSNVDVASIFVELRRLYHFKSDFISTKNDTQVLVRGNHSGVEAKSNVTFSLEIPHVEPTTSVRTCKYIQVSYEICVTVKVVGMHRSPVLTMPVIIGTIPLTDAKIASTSVNSLLDLPPVYDYAVSLGNEKANIETKQ